MIPDVDIVAVDFAVVVIDASTVAVDVVVIVGSSDDIVRRPVKSVSGIA